MLIFFKSLKYVRGMLFLFYVIALISLTASDSASLSAKTGDLQHETETLQRETADLQHESGNSQRPTVGLALGGGGTRGAAHIGVLRVFEKEGIPIDYIAGTSMGAIVGGLYDAKVPLSVCERRAIDGSIMSHFMTLPLNARIATAPVASLPRLAGFRTYDGLYQGNRFRKYLVKLIPRGDCRIEDLPIPFCAVALSLRDGKIHALDSGSLAYALQASSAIPALRKPVQIADDLYVDGGVVDNVPVDEARKMGADLVIAVNVDETFDEVPLKNFRKVGSVTQRLVNWQLWYHDAPLCKQADIVIHPDVDGVGLLSRSRKDVLHCIAAGEAAARDAMPAIKARLSQLAASRGTQSTTKMKVEDASATTATSANTVHQLAGD